MVPVSVFFCLYIHFFSPLHIVEGPRSSCGSLGHLSTWWGRGGRPKAHGFHTFSCFGPHIWNSLPQDLRHCSTLSSLKAKLKTFLFSQYFHPKYPVSATVSVCMCAGAHVRVCVCMRFFVFIILDVDCFGRTMLYMCIEYHI